MKKKNVVIIDYEMGNLFSVAHACEHVGLNPIISYDQNILLNADAAILPGVGAFGEAMRILKRLDLVYPIKDFIASGRPFMGICLGFQLLFTESEEFGSSKGLDIFDGLVKKFPETNPSGKKIKIPQIGWNKIIAPGNNAALWSNSPLAGIKQNEYMYFVHSFYVEAFNKEIVLALTDYNEIEYCSSIKSKNVFASQYHPEKSAKEGLKIYINWFSQINKREETDV